MSDLQGRLSLTLSVFLEPPDIPSETKTSEPQTSTMTLPEKADISSCRELASPHPLPNRPRSKPRAQGPNKNASRQESGKARQAGHLDKVGFATPAKSLDASAVDFKPLNLPESDRSGTGHVGQPTLPDSYEDQGEVRTEPSMQEASWRTSKSWRNSSEPPNQKTPPPLNNRGQNYSDHMKDFQSRLNYAFEQQSISDQSATSGLPSSPPPLRTLGYSLPLNQQLPLNSTSSIPYRPIRYGHSSIPANDLPHQSTPDQKSRGRWTGSPPKAAVSGHEQSNQSTPTRALRSSTVATRSLRSPTVSDSNVPESVRIVPVPMPTKDYLHQASRPPVTLHKPQSLLVVIDLNGTLVFRKKRSHSSNFIPRKQMDAFVQYIISTFSVLVWSSATPQNVSFMCQRIFNEDQRKLLVAEWARDKLGLNNWQYKEKVQVYKRLQEVWGSASIAARHPDFGHGGQWNQSNTVLVDDSIVKAKAQPYNIVEVSEFTGKEPESENVLKQVAAYLEQLRWQNDVSSFIHQNPFKVNTLWNTEERIEGFS
ncbi:MAG: hypothetical protein M1837_001709 [Sclerophora amabilis]|nr:MAG: hypothetical protein M1837_001709 [Sclerophora amabilis]